MAPHAVSHVRFDSSSNQYRDGYSKPSASAPFNQRTMIPPVSPDVVHDMICVGFGPASLAIAAALHDSVEFGREGFHEKKASMPKIAFLERQPSFHWHPGMQLPGATMQISWIKDFATLRNPRSSFTFLNYLWNVGRLLPFSNLGTFLPTRIEYEAYMKWVAGWFYDLVAYNQDCIEILPEETVGEQEVQNFVVRTQNVSTGEIETRRARHVVVSCGGKPLIPTNFPQKCPRVIHSSSYMWAVPELCPDREKPYRFAVVGSGQSAAETFHDLGSRYPNCNATLMIHNAALRPSDDSPFVNEMFNPDRIDDLYDIADDTRQSDIHKNKTTNYGVVRLELLETIYHDLYMQQVKSSDPEDWQHRILPYREVTSIESHGDKVKLMVENTEPLHKKGGRAPTQETTVVDAVIVAAGYQRNAHESLLSNAQHLIPACANGVQKWKVRRDYSVIFKPDTVSNNAGIWLQGSNESTHGLSDTLLSILAIRGQEVVDSIFMQRRNRKEGTKHTQYCDQT